MPMIKKETQVFQMILVKDRAFSIPAGTPLNGLKDAVDFWCTMNDMPIEDVHFEGCFIDGSGKDDSWDSLFDILDEIAGFKKKGIAVGPDPHFPHTCPNCGGPAFVGAYQVDCKFLHCRP